MKMTTRSIKPIGATIALAGLMFGSVACGNEELEPTAQEAPSTSAQETAPRSDAENSGGHATTNQQVGSTSGGTNQGSQNGAPAPAPQPNPGNPAPAPQPDPGNPAPRDCAPQKSASEIINNMGKLPPNKFGWKTTDKVSYNLCSNLSFALIEQAIQGNSQFRTQLMLFHKGKFIGIGSDTPQQVTDILGFDNDSVTVRMRDWEALDASGEANVAAPNYYSDVTFRWVGDHVQPEGRIPNQNLPKN